MKVSLSYHLDAIRITRILVGIMLSLLVLHLLAMQVSFNEQLGLRESLGVEYWQLAIFDLDEEESFGTWFSSAILFFAALLFFRQAGLCRSSLDPMRHWWQLMGIGFCLMSIDEVVGIHELVNTVFDESLWAGLSLGLVALTGFAFIPFLWRYRWRTSGLFLISAMLFVGGAVGVEQLSGTDLNSLGYNMLTGLEEGLEMSGVILSINTVLRFSAGESRLSN